VPGVVETDRLRLRRLTSGDLDALVELEEGDLEYGLVRSEWEAERGQP
jgi:hypothetical protein